MSLKKYSPEVESRMRAFFSQLSEKNQRHYAALEAQKLPYGGKKYIGELFNISQFRIRCGEAELNDAQLYAQIPADKERRPGGGRKKKN